MSNITEDSMAVDVDQLQVKLQLLEIFQLFYPVLLQSIVWDQWTYDWPPPMDDKLSDISENKIFIWTDPS